MRIFSIATVSFFLLTGSAFAADHSGMLVKGTKTLQLSGNLDTNTPADFDWSLDAGFGYFFLDNLEVGLGFGGNGDNFVTSYMVGAYGQYNFPTGTAVVPYVFLGGYYSGVKLDDEFYRDSDTDFSTPVGKAGAGFQWFIHEGIAIDVRGVYSFSSDSLWVNKDGEEQKSNIEGQLGIRIYWK